jgi:hypothetical protein
MKIAEVLFQLFFHMIWGIFWTILGKHWKALASVKTREPAAAEKAVQLGEAATSTRIEAKSG